MPDEEGRSRPNFFSRVLGDLFMASLPPTVRVQYTRNNPMNYDLEARRGADALFYEADRLAARGAFAMENVSYWTQRAGDILSAAISAGGAFMGAARAIGMSSTFTKALEAEMRTVPRPVRVGPTTGQPQSPRSTAQRLMAIRDEAIKITEKMEAQALEDGVRLKPTDKGEFMDAVTKALARDAIDKGELPNTLRIAPAPSAITGARPPQVRIPDFWDTNGTAYDVMTAVGREVIDHDLRYIWSPQNPLIMPDGTPINEVLPLLYPARGRPWPATVAPLPRGGIGLPSLKPPVPLKADTPSLAGAGTGIMSDAWRRAQEWQTRVREQSAKALRDRLERQRLEHEEWQRRTLERQQQNQERQREERRKQEERQKHERERRDQERRNQERANAERAKEDRERRDRERREAMRRESERHLAQVRARPPLARPPGGHSGVPRPGGYYYTFENRRLPGPIIRVGKVDKLPGVSITATRHRW